jgi:hypothetical protein
VLASAGFAGALADGVVSLVLLLHLERISCGIPAESGPIRASPKSANPRIRHESGGFGERWDQTS